MHAVRDQAAACTAAQCADAAADVAASAHVARGARTAVAELRDADFAACKPKSDIERGRNRQWQDARACEGRENVMVYRGKVEPAMFRSLMTS